MRTERQLRETIQRFQESFWDKQKADRPPVGLYSERMFLPINLLRRPFPRPTVSPDDVNHELVMTEYEYCFAERAVTCDDCVPFAAPWRGVPWIEACCGCPVRYSEGSLAPGHFVESPEALADLPIPAPNGWYDCLRRETERLERESPADCWVSPTILRGPSDVLAAMRGMTEFFLDLYDNPQALAEAAARVNQLLIKALDMHYSIVHPKLGGYAHIHGYWAPGKTIMIQEDVMGMCPPSMYEDIFMPLNANVVSHLGRHVLFHFHSTGYQHYQHVLKIPGLAGVEMIVETIGPSLLDLVPVFREILEKSRLIVHVGAAFAELTEVLPKLPSEGLFLAIPERFLRSDEEFRRFTATHWKR